MLTRVLNRGYWWDRAENDVDKGRSRQEVGFAARVGFQPYDGVRVSDATNVEDPFVTVVDFMPQAFTATNTMTSRHSSESI